MLLREEEEFNLGDYAQKVGDMVSKGLYTVGRGVPQALTGFPDLFSLPLTLSGMAKPEDIIGTTDYLTKRGLLPGPEQTLFGDSSAGTQADMLLGSTTPAGATKTALLGLAPFLPSSKNYLQEMFGQGKNVFEQTADLSKDINAPMLSKMYGKGGGGGLLGKFDDMDEYGYYSPTLRAVENINQPSGTGEQFLNMIKKSTKEEERAWMGLDDFLQSKDKFTKQEVMDYVKDNTINIQRDKLFDFRNIDERMSDDPRIGDNQVYGYDGAMDNRMAQLRDFTLDNISYDQLRFGDDLKVYMEEEGYRGLSKESIMENYLGNYDRDMNMYDFEEKLQAARKLISENRSGFDFDMMLPAELRYSNYITNQKELTQEFIKNELPKFVPSMRGADYYETGTDFKGIMGQFNIDTNNLIKVVKKIDAEEAKVGRQLDDEEIQEFLKDNGMFDHAQDDLSQNLEMALTELAEIRSIENMGDEFGMMPFDLYSNTGYQLRNIGDSRYQSVMFNGREESVDLSAPGENALDDLHLGMSDVEIQEQRAIRDIEGYPAPQRFTGGMADVGTDPYIDFTFEQKGAAQAPNYQVYGYRFKNPPQRGQRYEIDASIGNKPDVRLSDLADIDYKMMGKGHFPIPKESTSKFEYLRESTMPRAYGLAHLRFTDRVVDEYPDQKALFTEEIQSDAHKTARGDKGTYGSSLKDVKLFERQVKDLGAKFTDLDRKLPPDSSFSPTARRQNLISRIPDEIKNMSDDELLEALGGSKAIEEQRIKDFQEQAGLKKVRDQEQIKLIDNNKDVVLKSFQMTLQKLNSDYKSAIMARNKDYDEIFDAGADSPEKLYNLLQSTAIRNPQTQEVTGFIHKGQSVNLPVVERENIEYFFKTRDALNKLKTKDISSEEIVNIANDPELQDLSIKIHNTGTRNRTLKPNLLELSLKQSAKRMKDKQEILLPDFPLKNEHEFGVKESIKLAIDEGYDRVVFPTFKSVYSATGKASQENYKKMQKFIDSYAKKIGATVEEVTMTGVDGKKYKFKSIPITEELKNLIKNIGQPIVRRQDGAMGLLAMNEPMSMGIM